MTGVCRVAVLGGSFGGGQRSIAQALAAYLERRHSGEVEVRVVDFLEEFAPSLAVLARFGYERSDDFFPSISGGLGDLVRAYPNDAAVRELEQGAVRAAGGFMRAFAPDAVVSTFPFAGGVASELKASHGYVSGTLVTDLAPHGVWLHPATDLYFVACKESREDLVLGGVAWDRIVVSGIPVPLQPESEGSRVFSPRRFGMPDRFSVAVRASAGMPGVVELVTAFAAAGIRVFAITGGDDRLRRRFEAPGIPHDLIEVFDSSEDTGTIIGSADVLVARPGGRSMHEAMAAGTPVILCPPVPGHEVRNADQVVNHGAGLLARDEEDAFDKARFLSAHPGRIEQMSVNMAAIGSASAAQTVCERVLAAVDRSRDVSGGS